MSARHGGSEDPILSSGRNCILVVEDELMIRMMLSDELRDVGYHVIEACDAAEALVILDTVGPDLIISDVRMPGSIDGLGLLALVRKTLPTLPVIVMSGHLVQAQALTEGATRFVAKPFTIEAVIQIVDSELGMQR